jgi:hypothetical protein
MLSIGECIYLIVVHDLSDLISSLNDIYIMRVTSFLVKAHFASFRQNAPVTSFLEPRHIWFEQLIQYGAVGLSPISARLFQRKCCSPTRRHLSTFQVVVVHMAWSCRTFVQLFGLLQQDMDRCIKEIQSIPSREYALKDMLHTARHIVGSCPSQRTTTL